MCVVRCRYRELKQQHTLDVYSVLLAEDDVVVFCAAAMLAEALCVWAAAKNKSDQLRATIRDKQAKRDAQRQPTTSSGRHHHNLPFQQPHELTTVWSAMYLCVSTDRSLLVGWGCSIPLTLGSGGEVAAANPMMLALQAHKDVRTAQDAKQMLQARYTLSQDEVLAMRRFLRAAVLVLQASQKRRATAMGQFQQQIVEARVAFRLARQQEQAQHRQHAAAAAEAAVAVEEGQEGTPGVVDGDRRRTGDAGGPGDTPSTPASARARAARARVGDGGGGVRGSGAAMSPLLAAVADLPSVTHLRSLASPTASPRSGGGSRIAGGSPTARSAVHGGAASVMSYVYRPPPPTPPTVVFLFVFVFCFFWFRFALLCFVVSIYPGGSTCLDVTCRYATSVASFSSVRSSSTSLEAQAVSSRLEQLTASQRLGVHWNKYLLARLVAFVEHPLVCVSVHVCVCALHASLLLVVLTRVVLLALCLVCCSVCLGVGCLVRFSFSIIESFSSPPQ